MELKEYKDFKRPKFIMPEEKIIRCMNIDMTVTSRTVVNEKSTFVINSQNSTNRSPLSRSLPSMRMETRSKFKSKVLYPIFILSCPETCLKGRVNSIWIRYEIQSMLGSQNSRHRKRENSTSSRSTTGLSPRSEK